MQPDSFHIQKVDGDARKNKPTVGGDENIFEKVGVYLTGGDITRHDLVIWGFTPQESEPYIKNALRNELFREGVLAFLGVRGEENSPKSVEDKFCEACKAAHKGKQDCTTCSKKFEVTINAPESRNQRLNKSHTAGVR